MNNIKLLKDIEKSRFLEIIEDNHSISSSLRAIGVKYRNEIVVDLFKEKARIFDLDLKKIWKSKKFDLKKEDLKIAVKSSISVSEVLEKLGLSKYNSGNYKRFKAWKDTYKIDTSHFKGRSHGKGAKKIRLSLSEILVRESSYTSSHNLKNRLLKEGIFENKCSECGISKWRGKSLSIQLDHINGVSNDNRIKNLRLLCPNCHSQTETYAGKNRKAPW